MRLLIIIIFSLICQAASAQIFINEVCSDNESIIADEEGDYEDWIELYNGGNSEVNLEGYFLSDNEQQLDKWSFPDIEIPANGYLLLYASGKDFNGQHTHTNFKLSKEGEKLILSSPQSDILNQWFIPKLSEDHSYGRQPDGSENITYFFDPSPELSNNNSSTYNFASPPAFINSQYFNEESTSVEIDCNQPDCQIFYTTDGSIPDENSFLYNGPFVIDTTTTIRTSAISPTLLLSPPATRTYFIQENHELPVIALATSPENLWDWENGIFVEGPNADSIYPFFGANFWSDTEIPIHFEFFEDEELKVEYPLGAKVHGGKGARTTAMKPLRLLAKTSFGTNIVDYPFFKNRTNTKFERLVLRNASGDFNIGHMRDGFLARYFINEGFKIDALSDQPVVVYINGTYYGVMHLREKIDKFYLQYNYGIDPDNIDLLEEDTLIIEGDFNTFDLHESFVLNNELSNTSNFDIAADYFDLESLSDYVICQTFVNNTDWPSNNLKYWRERTTDAKWRYLLFDMDIAMARHGWSKASTNTFANKMQREDVRMVMIFKSFLENETFRNYFINRYLDLVNTSFQAENFIAEITRSRDELDFDIKRHLPAWGKTYGRWYDIEIPKLIKYANERPAYARQYLLEYFGLVSEDLITVHTFPQNAGAVEINTISVSKDQMPWNGYYFNEIPIQLSVIPEPGFTFKHWESSLSAEKISSDLSITVHPRNGEIFSAVFEHSPSKFNLSLFPNPVSDVLTLNFNAPNSGNVQINIYDAIGRQLFSLTDQIIITGDNEMELNINQLDQGIFIIEVIGSDFSVSKKFVKLFNRF